MELNEETHLKIPYQALPAVQYFMSQIMQSSLTWMNANLPKWFWW